MDTNLNFAGAEMERALIAALLVNPSERNAVRAIVRPNDLHVHDYQSVYAAVLRTGVVDVLTVEEELRHMNINPDELCDENGQPFSVVGLCSETVTGLEAQQYARYVADYAMRRRLIDSAKALANATHQLDQPVSDIVDACIHNLMRASASHFKSIPTIKEVAGEWCDHFLDSLNLEGRLPGIATKIRPLDQLLQGLRPGKLITIAARPGIGKSALMAQCAINAALAGCRTLFASLEMGESEVFGRMVANRTGLDTRPINAHKLTLQEQSLVVNTASRLQELPLTIAYVPGLTLPRLIGECERIVAMHGKLDLIVVDYVQLLRSEQTRKQQTRDSELSEITRGLKEIAGRFNACILAGSQLNRMGATDDPGLEHLRESGGFENDSDAVIMLWENKKVKLTLAEHQRAIGLAVKKNRDGALGTIDLLLDGTAQRLGLLSREAVVHE